MTEPSLKPEDDIAKRVLEGEVVHFDGADDAMSACPVQPLGVIDGNYYFTSPEGELRKLAARDFTDRHLTSLFAGDTTWMREWFPVKDKEGNRKNDFVCKHVMCALMRACHMRGMFNLQTPLRKYGVWRFGGRAVVHVGDGIFYNGSWMPPGKKLGEAIYIACSGVDRPDFDKPISAFEARELRQWMNIWAFTEKGDADLLFGWLGAALLGGFPNWRVHTFIIGDAGSGKSTLGEFICNCLGSQVTPMNNFTEAGVRQNLQDQARAISLDEAGVDSDTQRRRMNDVIRLIRQMAGGVGARIARGSAGGQVNNSTVTGCVIMTAAHPPKLDNQDRSRILEIAIKIPAQSESSKSDIQHFLAEAQRRSPQLRARALLRIDHFLKAFDKFNAALVAHGCTGRQSDIYATLLAGRSILLDDDVPAEEAVVEIIGNLKERLNVIFMQDSEDSDGRRCLNHLLDHIAENYHASQRWTIGQLIAGHSSGNSQESALALYGLRIERSQDDGMPRLFIMNSHGNLERVYANTAWEGAGWNKSMARLPDTQKSPAPVRVGGRQGRGLWLPYELLPCDKNPAADDYPPQPP